MTSKNSIYKMTLEHLRHSSWMIALSCIGNLLAGPVILLFYYSNINYEYQRLYNSPEVFLMTKARDAASGMDHLCGSMFLGIAMAGALIVALGIFYYLFQSSKVDLYHSLPLTRKELFYSGYLAGFLIWLVPFIISSLITLPLAIFWAGGFQHINMLLVAFLKMLVLPLIGFIIIYHLCLVAVMLSGNMANAVIAIFVWGLAPLVFYLLFTVHFGQYFETFYDFTINEYALCAITPMATPIFIQACQMSTSPEHQIPLMVIVGLLIAVFNFFVARTIYQKRKSELAGRGMEHPIASFLIRFCTAFAAGLFGVLFLYFVGLSKNRVVWSVFFSLFFSVFTFAVLSAVQKKTIKGLFAHKAQMLITSAAAIGFILICRFDIFGYDTYLPDKANLESAEFRIYAMNNYYYSYNDDSDLYTCRNTDVIYDILAAGVNKTPYSSCTNVVIKVNPKHGFSYYRSYPISVDKVDVLRPIIEDDDYFTYVYENFINNASEFGSMQLLDLMRNNLEIEDDEQTLGLWKAYYTDLTEHRSMEEMTEFVTVGEIQFFMQEDSENYTYLRELPINRDFRHTIAYLNEHYPNLVLNKDDLDIRALHISLSLREELSVEEYYLEKLTPSNPTELVNSTYSYDEQIVCEITDVAYYDCDFTPEELTWLYQFLQPCHELRDSLNADNYVYFGELEITTGRQLSCYIEKGSMTTEDIQKLAEMVEKNYVKSDY